MTPSSHPALTPEGVQQIIADVLHARHFFVGDKISLQWEEATLEETSWEVFQGRLLDRAQTRLRRSFLAWNIFCREDSGRSAEPLLSVKLDTEVGQLHVVRGLHCYVWEGYHAGDNVYLSRETTRWVRELVGTLSLARGLAVDELASLLFRAVVGVSRLPFTSVESPLPAFSLGQLAYFYQAAGAADSMRSYRELLTRGLTAEDSWLQKAKLLEVLLRAVPQADLGAAANLFAERWQTLGHDLRELPRLFRTLFNEVALSPWTGFVDNALDFVQLLAVTGQLTVAEYVDFLSYLLRQLGRHLTAYDLVTFHHRGANYPDALLLNAVLKRYLSLAKVRPSLFTEAAGRLRRRALRQGWLLRRQYEGHAVPDAPTSPGENARVLPAPHVRVPEEQILQIGKRRKTLFTGDPLDGYLGDDAAALLRRSVQDLQDPTELRELGMAIFIDRPLGVFKAPAEPDQTWMLSCEAFSRSIALRRLDLLARERLLLLSPQHRDACRRLLQDGLPVQGLSLSAVAADQGRLVSLADARRASDDFVLLRTTRQSLRDFLAQYDLRPLAQRFDVEYLTAEQALIVPAPPLSPERTLLVYDGQLQQRLELVFQRQQGYEVHGGREVLVGGLHVRRVWEPAADGQELRAHDVRSLDLVLKPNLSRS